MFYILITKIIKLSLFSCIGQCIILVNVGHVIGEVANFSTSCFKVLYKNYLGDVMHVMGRGAIAATSDIEVFLCPCRHQIFCRQIQLSFDKHGWLGKILLEIFIN